ncbi:hypothetical protein [Streptomyces sp. PU-14G]|uniref:hypothetical protein n=1 Tax=Streptomyces sp. PU-14G TaxID=2800808 RepID=UPI0034DE8EDE
MRNYRRAAVVTAAAALCAVTGGGVMTAQAAAPGPDQARTATAAKPAPAPTADSAARLTAKCPYPYVCFTKGTTILSKYKDAGYWQTLGPKGRTADSANNTRHDDVVYVRFSNAKTICMKPGEGWAFNGAHPRQVYISTSSTCK